jgi:pyridoxamine--pyruvate transaminase
MGLELWADSEEICATCTTAIKTPEGVNDARLRRHLYDRYRVLIAGGVGDLIGKVFRIGHMGKKAQPVYVAAALAMVEKSLHDLGYPVKLGSGVGAALEAV